MTAFIVDLLVLMILGFCVWQGYRKGLILSAAGVLILIIGVIGGVQLANRLGPSVSVKMGPLLDWVADDATDEAVRASGGYSAFQDIDTVETIARGAFERLGIQKNGASKLSGRVWDRMQALDTPLNKSVAAIFIEAVCWVGVFLFGFVILSLLLTLAAHFVSMLFTIPGLNLLDTVGGLGFGLLQGLLILFAVGWVFRYLGILIPDSWTQNTLLLRFFVNVNPFDAFLLKI